MHALRSAGTRRDIRRNARRHAQDEQTGNDVDDRGSDEHDGRTTDLQQPDGNSTEDGAAFTVDGVVVATDDQRILDAVHAFGGAACLTRTDHLSGTDRLAEVARGLSCRLVVNVQGDEPLIEPEVIDAVVQPLLDDPSKEMGTACRPLLPDEFSSPSIVKVVRGLRDEALYFSRAGIPFPRSGPAVPDIARAHIGLYVYRRDTLLRLAALPATELEQVESLEQLRALANGIAIHVVQTSHHAIGVDTPEDLDRVRHWLLTESRT